MTRVLFTHSYSMDLVRSLCAGGRYPRHHLWGADALEHAGFDVRYGFFGARRRALRRLSWGLRHRLGDLEQEAAMWRRACGSTVIYAGEATLVSGLALLRRAGWRVPVVAVVHSAGPPARLDRAWVSGLDVAVCLSSRVRARLVGDYGRDPAATPLLAWGPDLAFPGYRPSGQELVVSAGKSERDVETLVEALQELGQPARVYVDGPRAPADADGIEIVPTDAARGRLVDYATVLDDLCRASIVAIPLRRTDAPRGLSEINDALALAKPIVMTRTDAIDFDPERIGCGITVEPGDVAGWHDALGRLQADAALRGRMGRRGREFAERGYNADAFRAGIVAAVRRVSGS